MRGCFPGVGAEQGCSDNRVSRLSRNMNEQTVLIEIKSVALGYLTTGDALSATARGSFVCS